MQKIILATLFVASACALVSCSVDNPEKTFGIAILNTNLMHGFAGRALEMELESPSVKLLEGSKDKVVPMKRVEIINAKIESIESNYSRLKNLTEHEDNREVLKASRALYEYVLPVYKKEYMELARLYDDESPKETIEAYTRSIEENYYPGFYELHEKLTAAGKPYAAKHGINVNWNVSTSPR